MIYISYSEDHPFETLSLSKSPQDAGIGDKSVEG